MAKIIWEGNQPWDKKYEGMPLHSNAKKIKKPKNIFTVSLPYGILPMIICFLAVFFKTRSAQSFLFDFRFILPAFIIGFIFALPLHELFHALCYPKDAEVHIGLCLQKVAAFAISFNPISRRRFILMSLAPMLLGIMPLLIFIICPVSQKWLLTLCIVPSFMGLISPMPDYMDVCKVLKQVPENAKIQASNEGLFWYL